MNIDWVNNQSCAIFLFAHICSETERAHIFFCFKWDFSLSSYPINQDLQRWDFIWTYLKTTTKYGEQAFMKCTLWWGIQMFYYYCAICKMISKSPRKRPCDDDAATTTTADTTVTIIHFAFRFVVQTTAEKNGGIHLECTCDRCAPMLARVSNAYLV